jgi:hypothetical protein
MHVKYVEEEGKTVIYPKVKQDSQFDSLSNASVVITENLKSVNILHRQKREGEMHWDLVQFSAMGMDELQQYIDELQKIRNRLNRIG